MTLSPNKYVLVSQLWGHGRLPVLMFSPVLDKKSSSVSSNFVSCSRRDLGLRYTQRTFRVVFFIAIVDETRSVRGGPSCLI